MRLLFLLVLLAAAILGADDHPLVPRLVGEWWTVAGNPDLGPLSTEKQQVVDFGLWLAADVSWQLWSCIRNTNEGGKTRLFHRWEGAKLTHRDWTPNPVEAGDRDARGAGAQIRRKIFRRYIQRRISHSTNSTESRSSIGV